MKLLKQTKFYSFNHFLVKFWTHFGKQGDHNCQGVLLPAKNPVLPKGATAYKTPGRSANQAQLSFACLGLAVTLTIFR